MATPAVCVTDSSVDLTDHPAVAVSLEPLSMLVETDVFSKDEVASCTLLNIIPPKEDEVEKTSDITGLKESEILKECDKVSCTSNFSNITCDANLNVNESIVKKNRRKKKGKESSYLSSDRTLMENVPSNTPEISSNMIETLNEVFTTLNIHNSQPDVTKCVQKKRQTTDNESEVQRTEHVYDSRTKDTCQEFEKRGTSVNNDVECVSVLRDSQCSDTHNSAMSGKPKLTEKKKKIRKNGQQKRDEKLENDLQQNARTDVEPNVSKEKSSVTHEHQSCTPKGFGRSKSRNGKKKLPNDARNNVMPDTTVPLGQDMAQFCELLSSTCGMSGLEHSDMSVRPSGSSKKTVHENCDKPDNEVTNDSTLAQFCELLNSVYILKPLDYVGTSVRTSGSSKTASENKPDNIVRNDPCIAQFHELLNSARDSSSLKRVNSSNGTSGCLETVLENCNTQDSELKNDLKLNRRVSKDLQRLEKTAKMLIKKQDSSEGQKKKKKKEKPKGKKIASNSTSDNSVNSKEKETKKKGKKFEEYWTLEAVQEGLRNGTVIEGAIRINSKRYTEAYVSSPKGSQDILIEGMIDRNRALEGDLVALELKDPSEWKLNHSKSPQQGRTNDKCSADTSELCEEEELVEDSSILENKLDKNSKVTGKVVAILSKQHSRKCVGYLKLMKKPNNKNALFSPRDVRIPRMQIPYNKCPPDFWLNPASLQDVLYLARMTKWTTGTFALGEIVEQIGQATEVDAETTALILDNDLDVTPYPDDFSDKFPSLSEALIESEMQRREDLRKQCIFTIDPQTAKDLDDAVCCRELDNGNLEVGVHISDVTFFLEEGSPLDCEVSKRATSVYLVDTVHHMLPVNLCLLCSLLPRQDKLAYSVVWEMTRDAKIVSQRIVRSVINSCVKLAYEHAQIMLENPGKELDQHDFPEIGNGFSLSDISKVVNNLQMIAQQLRRQRFEDGALRIDQTKIFLQLNPSGMPVGVHEYINKESHRLIEEFMLLANMSVAKFIYEKFPKIAFLRCHEEPHRYPLEQLQESMASRGIHLNITSAGALQASLTRYAGTDYLSLTRLMVLNALCAKTMTRARYFCTGGQPEEEFWHYALNVPYYTHFTSPIRRYADIMVHRLLNSGLGYSMKPSWTEEYVCGIASNCNKKKYSAKLAGEQSVKLYLSIYIKYNQPTVEDAVVVDVKDHSFDVIVCKYGLTMRVYLSKLDVNFEHDSGKKASSLKIIWKPSNDCSQSTVQIVEVFTIVKVNVTCPEDSLKLEAVLIRPTNVDSLAVTCDGTL